MEVLSGPKAMPGPKELNGLFTPPMTERIEVKHVRYLVPRG